jgi:8-oxo-dGTP diphosphatase
MKDKNIICTVDVVLLTLYEDQLHVATLNRERDPFKGSMALPGGYLHIEEDVNTRAAAMRVLKEKINITPPYLEQLESFSGPNRDPRGWSISVAYYALVNPEMLIQEKNSKVLLSPVDGLRDLPFDHNTIVDAAISRLRSKSQYSSLPCYLAGEHFTLPHLQRIYELLLGESLNKVSFRRKIDEMGMLEPIQGEMAGGAFRPAQLYRIKGGDDARITLLDRGL